MRERMRDCLVDGGDDPRALLPFESGGADRQPVRVRRPSDAMSRPVHRRNVIPSRACQPLSPQARHVHHCQRRQKGAPCLSVQADHYDDDDDDDDDEDLMMIIIASVQSNPAKGRIAVLSRLAAESGLVRSGPHLIHGFFDPHGSAPPAKRHLDRFITCLHCITSSTKPEVHNVLDCHQKRTERLLCNTLRR